MSDENTSTQETNIEAAPVTTVAPVKRGRGRPPGSKNKPKDPNAPAKVKTPRAPKPDVEAVVKPAPSAPVSTVFVAADEDVVEASVDTSVEE